MTKAGQSEFKRTRANPGRRLGLKYFHLQSRLGEHNRGGKPIWTSTDHDGATRECAHLIIAVWFRARWPSHITWIIHHLQPDCEIDNLMGSAVCLFPRKKQISAPQNQIVV